ncbi:MAG: RpiB/LacA/LacB family sugar-phosphate isomerase [Nitriliruptorales bacterium]|nr:RpiB/LacA/LacB family sugar-phosphate isomerase [Nitriliruptorales bacterium]
MRVALGNDQAGYPLKQAMVEWLVEQGHAVDDRGTDGTRAVDYPPICVDVGRQVVEGHAERGLILGGSGMGEVIALNKVPGVRAGLCHCLYTARISRANNDANVLVLAAKIIAPALAQEITALWLSTSFEGGRHVPRLEQIAAIERREPLD